MGTYKAEHENLRDVEPCQSVLSTAEILESILEYLPPTQLYAIQRVNKRFRDVVVGSSRIQRKMFLRIDDKPSTVWHLHSERTYSSHLYFVQGDANDSDKENMLTLIAVNPNMLRWQAQYRLAIKYSRESRDILERGETLRFHPGQNSALQDPNQQYSIMDGFLSDPHCKKIDVSIKFALGQGLPVFLTVSSIVESDTPLTIKEIIARAMNTDGEIWMKWSVAGKAHMGRPGWRKGVPWHLMSQLRDEFGFKFFFVPSSSSFLLCRTLVPTDEQRASIAWTDIEHEIYHQSGYAVARSFNGRRRLPVWRRP